MHAVPRVQRAAAACACKGQRGTSTCRAPTKRLFHVLTQPATIRGGLPWSVGHVPFTPPPLSCSSSAKHSQPARQPGRPPARRQATGEGAQQRAAGVRGEAGQRPQLHNHLGHGALCVPSRHRLQNEGAAKALGVAEAPACQPPEVSQAARGRQRGRQRQAGRQATGQATEAERAPTRMCSARPARPSASCGLKWRRRKASTRDGGSSAAHQAGAQPRKHY
jgi:hypothetical protein